MLEAAVLAEHGVLLLEPVVNRRGLERPRGDQLLVREADAEAARIILAHLGVGVAERGPVAVARHVHAPDVRARITLDHPARQRETDAPALAETRHHAAGHPEI